MRQEEGRGRHRCGKRYLFLSAFPYVCPEPVLAKSVLIYKWLKNAVFFADLSGSWDEGTVA
eukprot:COSAG06_NODE_1543_length_9141_cov_4.266202_9_plen_61_part_00